jgi:aspartyl/asparaginyl beta-hydroxylase (cupin superfamily)
MLIKEFNMSVELKIKSKHLGLEAKVIKFEEAKLKRQIRWHSKRLSPNTKLEWKLNSITNHRKWDVRNENRATFLARAYIDGVPYNTVEKKRRPENEYKFEVHVLPRVLAMVNRYHNRNVTKEAIEEWVNA